MDLNKKEEQIPSYWVVFIGISDDPDKFPFILYMISGLEILIKNRNDLLLNMKHESVGIANACKYLIKKEIR